MSRLVSATRSLALVTLAFASSACGKSKTAEQIVGFADKVCACKDAACAEAVQADYLKWWKGNQRARGSEGDRKTVETAMQKYAECHLALVGPSGDGAAAKPIVVPTVNLAPPPAPASPPTTVEPAPATAPEPAAGSAPATAPEPAAATE